MSTHDRLTDLEIAALIVRNELGWALDRIKSLNEEAGNIVEAVLVRAFDETRCNDCCKGLYFCDLPKDHKGGHLAGGLGW
jgi:hypothetical protein